MDNRDPEIELLAHVYNALEVLDQMGRKRALCYLSDRLLAGERSASASNAPQGWPWDKHLD